MKCLSWDELSWVGVKFKREDKKLTTNSGDRNKKDKSRKINVGEQLREWNSKGRKSKLKKIGNTLKTNKGERKGNLNERNVYGIGEFGN